MRCYVTSQSYIDAGLPPLVVNTLWDTGSTRSAVSPRLAKALGLTLNGYHNVQTAVSPNERTALLDGLYHVVSDSVFGPFTVDVVTLDFDDTPEERRMDMIIGMDFIAQGIFSIKSQADDTYLFMFDTPDAV